MKKVILFIVLASLLFSIMSIEIFAEEAEEVADTSEEEKSFWENISNTFGNISDFFSNNVFFNFWDNLAVTNLGNDTNDLIPSIKSGGYQYVTGSLNNIIAMVYNILYPIGFAIMLVAWCFNVGKSSIICTLDIKDKNSLLNSILSLIIGLAAMAIAPKILTVLVSVSNWLCNTLIVTGGVQTAINETITSLKISGISLSTLFTGSTNNSTYAAIVLLVVDLIFILNVLWIALLQALSPIFVAFFGNESTRRLSLSFIKEYFKALLVPPVTLIYMAMCVSILREMSAIGIVTSIVLAISTLGIAGKKLDKLIN